MSDPILNAGGADVRKGARVHLQKVEKTFEKNGRSIRVIDDLSLEVEAGGKVAIIGQSGAGKSTLLHIIGTLDAPTRGTVEIDGIRVDSLSENALAKFRNSKIGFMFQFHHLLPEFTAAENVMMPALIQRMDPGEARKKAEHVLGLVGLAERVEHQPGELSGGEQQRVALARALVLDPALLLADEPTGNLDDATGAGVHDLLSRLNAEYGITLMVVTHNRAWAERMPRILEMREGKLQPCV